jgi:hypothetical protein
MAYARCRRPATPTLPPVYLTVSPWGTDVNVPVPATRMHATEAG